MKPKFGVFSSLEPWWEKTHTETSSSVEVDYFQSLGSSMTSLSDAFTIRKLQENYWRSTNSFVMNYSVNSRGMDTVPYVPEGVWEVWWEGSQRNPENRVVHLKWNPTKPGNVLKNKGPHCLFWQEGQLNAATSATFMQCDYGQNGDGWNSGLVLRGHFLPGLCLEMRCVFSKAK